MIKKLINFTKIDFKHYFFIRNILILNAYISLNPNPMSDLNNRSESIILTRQ